MLIKLENEMKYLIFYPLGTVIVAVKVLPHLILMNSKYLFKLP